MPVNERLLTDSPQRSRRRRWRLATHLAVFIAALGFTASATSAAPTVQEGRFLAADTVTYAYTCAGADEFTQTILSGLGLATFQIDVDLTSVAVEPSPSPGEEFDVDFLFDTTLPLGLVQKGVQAGATGFQITSDYVVSVVDGATGPDTTGTGGPTDVLLGDGTVPVGYTHGPFTGTYTRTAEVDEPITFLPGTINTTVLTQPSAIQLLISCNPPAGAEVLSMVDTTGQAPETTTTTRPPVVTTEATTPTTAAAVGGAGAEAGGELPRTGATSTLFYVVLALGLIDLGYLALSESKRTLRQGSSAS